MRRTTQIVVMCALLCACVAAALAHGPLSGRAYTFAALAAGLGHQPNAWIGRTVVVQARAVATCAGCRHEQDLLADPQLAHPPDAYTSIPIVIKPDALTALVRRIPLLGAVLVPAPRLPLTGTFRVRIERDPKAGTATSCALWSYYAILVGPL